MRATAVPGRPRSWPSASSSELRRDESRKRASSMAEVLVLAEHSGGAVKKVTTELLTAARRLGSPSVAWAGPGAGEARAKLAEFGAGKVYVADSADFAGYVV